MKLIDEHYEAVEEREGKEVTDFYHWEFVIKESDFFLLRKPIWHLIKSPSYTIKIGSYGTVRVPANYYLMLGDADGSIDFIKVDEIAGRPFDTLTFKSNMDGRTWSLTEVTVIGYTEEDEHKAPETKNPFPVMVGEDHAIILASSDLYNKMKKVSFIEMFD